jgi:hypothetical protein
MSSRIFMRRELPVATVCQDASFALFEGLRATHSLALDVSNEVRVTFERQVDPAERGLAFTNTGDAALEFGLDHPTGRNLFWVYATGDSRGPQLAVYFEPCRPALLLRFAAPSLLALENGRYLLRERPTFPSHDGRQEERKSFLTDLSRPFGVPLLGPWMHLGAWDALDRSWQPETVRRVLACSVLLERARSLDSTMHGPFRRNG